MCLTYVCLCVCVCVSVSVSLCLCVLISTFVHFLYRYPMIIPTIHGELLTSVMEVHTQLKVALQHILIFLSLNLVLMR